MRQHVTSIKPVNRRVTPRWTIALFVLGILSAWQVYAAEEPSIQAGTNVEEIFVGESVEYHVEIRNSKNPSAPDMSAIKNLFDVTANGDESRNQSSTFIINGRVSQQNVLSHVYHFVLTPKESGELTIPAATATVDGKVLTGPQLPLKVVTPEEQDLVLVEVKASHERVYPTQPFSVTVRVLVHPLPNDGKTDPLIVLRRRPPHLQLNWVDSPAGLAADTQSQWLQPLLSNDGTGFTLNEISTRTGSFFDGPRAAVFKLFKGRETRKGLDGEDIRYFVYELTRKFTPERTGEYSFGPAVVKGTFVTGIEGNEYSAKRLVSIGQAATVEVREVPTPRPPSFCGGIGEYHVNASANPLKLRVGDPLTLTLEFEKGDQSGSLELISAPDLSSNEQLMADFDLIDKNPTGRSEGPVKKFSYALRPRRSNVSLPSLSVSTFDPRTEQFVDTSTAEIPLEVSDAVRLNAADLVGSIPSTSTTEIKSRAQGIFQNITDPHEVRDQRVNVGVWVGAPIAAWLLAAIVMASITIYRRKSTDPGWRRRQQARSTANRALSSARSALTSGKAEESLNLVRAALLGFIADMQNRVAGGLTAAEADQALQSAGISLDDRESIRRLLESIESAAYGGSHQVQPDDAIKTATSLISRIGPKLARGA